MKKKKVPMFDPDWSDVRDKSDFKEPKSVFEEPKSDLFLTKIAV